MILCKHQGIGPDPCMAQSPHQSDLTCLPILCELFGLSALQIFIKLCVCRAEAIGGVLFCKVPMLCRGPPLMQDKALWRMSDTSVSLSVEHCNAKPFPSIATVSPFFKFVVPKILQH